MTIVNCVQRYHESIILWSIWTILFLDLRSWRLQVDDQFSVLYRHQVKHCNNIHVIIKKNVIFAKDFKNIALEACCFSPVCLSDRCNIKWISVECVQWIPVLSAIQFTVQKSDFKWFATNDRDRFCSTTSNIARNFTPRKAILVLRDASVIRIFSGLCSSFQITSAEIFKFETTLSVFTNTWLFYFYYYFFLFWLFYIIFVLG